MQIQSRVKNYINTTKVILSVVIDGFKIFVSEGRESETFLLTLKSHFQTEHLNPKYYDKHVFNQMRPLSIR